MSSGNASYQDPELLVRRRTLAGERRVPLNPQAPSLEQQLTELCAIDDPRVLDVGCGHGDLATLMLPHMGNGSYVGLDTSRGMLTVLRQRLADPTCPLPQAWLLIEGRAERLPLAKNSVDAVLCGFVLFFLGASELSEALAEIRRVLRPGGRLLANAYGDATTSADLEARALDHVCPGATLSGTPPAWRVETASSLLEPHFRQVRHTSTGSRISFPRGDADALSGYLLSYRGELADRLPEGVEATAFFSALDAIAREHARTAAWQVSAPMEWLLAE